MMTGDEKTFTVELWGKERKHHELKSDQNQYGYLPFKEVEVNEGVGMLTCPCGYKMNLHKTGTSSCLKCGVTVLSADEFEAVIKVRR